jgi:F420-dependent oxidoreductase-like protein
MTRRHNAKGSLIMRIGLQLPFFDWDGRHAERLAAIATAAEDAGFYSLWVMDHFFQMEMAGDAADPMLEAYTTLGYLAGKTQQIKLGVLVTGVIYRHPGILAKTVTTLDVLSQGRAYLGIGAAWYEREALGLGVPFPPLAQRFEQLEETLQIVKQMWSENNGEHRGVHFTLNETLNYPQPISHPHPPIMIGGMGEKKTLRMVAQYGNASNFDTGIGVEGLRHKLDVLREHCDVLGRDYNAIEKTVIHHVPSMEALAEIPALCAAWAEIGIDQAIFNMRGVETITPIEAFGRDIIPVAASL